MTEQTIKKQNVLIIADSVFTYSGVANQTAEIAKALFNKGYGVFQIGVSPMQPGQKLLHTFKTGEQVHIYTEHSYDNVPLILSLIHEHNIRAIILVTDPHKFLGVWLNARTIRNLCPLVYWNLWDSNLLPKNSNKHYNHWIYESADRLPCISQQSENFVKQIVSDLPESSRPVVTYIPHGSNEYIFKPLAAEVVSQHRKNYFHGKEYDYIVLFNSRNQLRKKPAELIYSWALFCEGLTEDEKSKVALVLHTEPVSQVGTDLNAVIDAFAPNCNIYIDHVPRSQEEMNVLYNIADVTFCVSNAEGFGLSAQESLLAGTPIAATVTGGLQDSIGFFDDGGNAIKFGRDFSSNNVGKYRNHGTWSYPMFPDAQSIIGSPMTPYLFDDNVSFETIRKGLYYWFDLPREERRRKGLKGREYCEQSNFTATALAELFAKEVTDTIKTFKPRQLFELVKA